MLLTGHFWSGTCAAVITDGPTMTEYNFKSSYITLSLFLKIRNRLSSSFKSQLCKFSLLHTYIDLAAKFVTCLKRPVRPRYSRYTLIVVHVFSCSTYQAYSLICTGELSKEHRKGMQVYQIVNIWSNLESCNKKTTFFIPTLYVYKVCPGV